MFLILFQCSVFFLTTNLVDYLPVIEQYDSFIISCCETNFSYEFCIFALDTISNQVSLLLEKDKSLY